MNRQLSVLSDRRSIVVAIIAFLLGALLALAGMTLTSAMGNGAAVVSVNGEPITREAFYERLEHEAGQQVLDQLISETLVAQSASRYDDVEVTPEEIAAEVEAIKKNYGSDEAFQDALARFDLTVEQLERDIRLNLIVNKLTRRGVEVTDEEIKTYFEENKESLGQPEQVKVRHILVDTKEEADALAKQLEEGADFEELAAAHSTDTATAANGGVVGYIHAESPIVPSFKEAAFQLDVGEVSEPVKSDFGWHIIRVDDRKEAKEATLEGSRDLIRERLMSEKARPVGDVISELRAGADIEVHWPRYEQFANDPNAKAPSNEEAATPEETGNGAASPSSQDNQAEAPPANGEGGTEE